MSQTVEGLADSVDNVRLAQLQAGGTAQLVVGYAASQDDHYLAVYSYENGEVSAMLEQAYEQYVVEDITGGGSEDLILMSTLEDSGVQIELLTVDRAWKLAERWPLWHCPAISSDSCQLVAAGLGADGKHYLVLDGWTGISGNNLASIWWKTMAPADGAGLSNQQRGAVQCRSRNVLQPREARIWTATAPWRYRPSRTKRALLAA